VSANRLFICATRRALHLLGDNGSSKGNSSTSEKYEQNIVMYQAEITKEKDM
jgi:hypothetical protein